MKNNGVNACFKTKTHKTKRRFWDIRKISFAAILIAIAVVFAIIGTQILVVASLPTFKISFIGLPIKITGFIFGPFVGVLTGLISDLISFVMLPVFFNPLYTVATMMNGLISGIVGWFFVKVLNYYFGYDIRIKWHKKRIEKYNFKINQLKQNNINWKTDDKITNTISHYQVKILYLETKIKRWEFQKYSKTLVNINMIFSILILSIIIVTIAVLFSSPTIVTDEIINKAIIKNRWGLLALLVTGFGTMLIFIVVARFKMKPEKFTIIVPIIIFSAILELVNVPILSIADATVYAKSNQWPFYMFTHIITSPIKIWINLTVIYYAYTIMSKLINKNSEVVY